MKNRAIGQVLLLLIAGILVGAGCAQRPAPIEERSLAAQVRQQAAETAGVVEVFPLSGGEDGALIERARQAEAEGALEQASILISQAIELAPQDAAHWQYLAEIELEQGQYSAAIDHARESYELGPRVGQICARNWLTIQRANEALRRSSAAIQAGARAEECAVRNPSTY
ncbi:MAG: tetratricopeptide repeat protein [Pseudomonadota bacterium]